MVDLVSYSFSFPLSDCVSAAAAEEMASELILLSPPPVVPTIEDGDSFAEISKKLAS